MILNHVERNFSEINNIAIAMNTYVFDNGCQYIQMYNYRHLVGYKYLH